MYIYIYNIKYVFFFFPTLLCSNARQFFIERLLIILKCAGQHKKYQINKKKTGFQKSVRKNKSANNDDFFLMCCMLVKIKVRRNKCINQIAAATLTNAFSYTAAYNLEASLTELLVYFTFISF